MGQALFLVPKLWQLGQEGRWGRWELLHLGRRVYADLSFSRGPVCFTDVCECVYVREKAGTDSAELAVSELSGGLAVSDPASFSLLSCSPCTWSRLPRDAKHFSAPLSRRCGGTAEEMEPMPLPSSSTIKRLTAVIQFFKNWFCK